MEINFVTSPTRRCGDCQLCCKLLPVRELNKDAGQRCRHQKFGKGCLVYHRPEKGFPLCCGFWNCAWLIGAPETENLPRPDRSHYVIDVMPDFVTLRQDDGTAIELPVIQIWVDPAFPDAHRCKHLRAYIDFRARRDHAAALIRYDESRGFAIFAPCLSSDGQWHEKHSNVDPERTHSFAEIARVVAS